jgi:hypothetical protein
MSERLSDLHVDALARLSASAGYWEKYQQPLAREVQAWRALNAEVIEELERMHPGNDVRNRNMEAEKDAIIAKLREAIQ